MTYISIFLVHICQFLSHRYSCFGLLVTSHLRFRVGSPIRTMWCTVLVVHLWCDPCQPSSRSRGGGDQGSHPPPHVKNSHKIDGNLARWLIFYVSCPPPRPLCEVSGSATVDLSASHRYIYSPRTGHMGGKYLITIFDNHYNFHHSFQLNKQDFCFVTDFLKLTCQDHCYDCFKLTCLFWSPSVLYRVKKCFDLKVLNPLSSFPDYPSTKTIAIKMNQVLNEI